MRVGAFFQRYCEKIHVCFSGCAGRLDERPYFLFSLG